MEHLNTPYKHQQNLWSRGKIFLLLTLSLCVYVPFQSISLDDFDSYSFALALEQFSLELQQPQPPGFPVYIFLGRLFYALVQNPTAALTLYSALSACGVTLLIYLLGNMLSKEVRRTGVIAALWMTLLPMQWLTAGKVLSDMPGLFWTLFALLCWWKGIGNPRYLVIGGLVTGIALGVRPQNALPIILLMAYTFILTFVKRKSLSPLFIAAACGLVGVSLWLLPTTRAVGGFSAYVSYVRGHAAHVGAADSLMGMSVPLDAALRARGLAFGDTFLSYTIGVSLFNPWDFWQILRALSAALIVGYGLMRADWRRSETWALLVWLASVTAQIFVFEILDRPRLMLPILPPLVLLVAQGWAQCRKPRWLVPIVMCIVSLLLLMQGVPLVTQLASIPAPPAQAAAYIMEQYPPRETLLATAGSFRAIQVELPTYEQVYLYRFDPDSVRAALDGGVRYIVILDRDQFPAEVVDVLSDAGHYVPLEERTFSRDRRVHTQHDQVRVQVLTPAALIPPEALALPANNCIDIGAEIDGRYLSMGWFRPEDVGGASARWAGSSHTAVGSETSTVRVTLAAARAYELRFRALAYPLAQTVTVRVNEQVVEQVALSQSWQEVTMRLTGNHIKPDQVTVLALEHGMAQSPFEVSGTSDTRALTAAYDWVCVTPLP